MRAHLDNWLEKLDQQGKSRSTISSYRRGVEHLFRWLRDTYVDEVHVTAVIRRDVRDWRSYQQTVERARPATINQRLVAVSRFFDYLVAEGVVRSNPAGDVAGVQLNGRKPKALGRADLRRLLRAVHQAGDRRDVAMIELLAGAGLRASELLSLQPEDVTIRERSGQVVVREGKHGRYREVPLTRVVREVLTEYLHHLEAWPRPLFGLTDRSSTNRVVSRYARAAGLEGVSPHTLRHTFATEYLAANPGDIRSLAAILGHSDIKTTMIYTEPALGDLADRMERVR